MSASEDRFRRILVICTRQIGDVLLTTPLIRAAKQRWPAAQVDMLGYVGSVGMLRGNPDVSEVIEIEPGMGWLRSLPLAVRLWRRYDLALLTQRSDREYLYGWVAARTRSGLVPGHSLAAAWKRWLLDHSVADSLEREHIVGEKLKLLSPWIETPSRVDVIPPPGEALPDGIERALSSAPVVVHVPSMWRYKQWPLDSYRQVIQTLLARGHQVVLSGGPGEGDRSKVAAMLDIGQSPQLLNCAGTLNLNQMTSLLRRASLYIGPDTSITHLAAAVGTQVIAVFGPTNPVVWGPWPNGRGTSPPFERRGNTQRAKRVILLQGPNACVPCRLEGCERHPNSRSDCLEAIAPERVLSLALELLEPPTGRVSLAGAA